MNNRNQLIRAGGAATALGAAALLKNPKAILNAVEAAKEMYFANQKLRTDMEQELYRRKSAEMKSHEKRSSHNLRGAKKAKDSTAFSSAPVSVGNSATQTYATLQGKPQRLTDQTGAKNFGGVRVAFSDILSAPCQQHADYDAYDLKPAFNKGAGAAADFQNWVYFGPGSLSARLGRISVMYQFYAIRELTFEYIPVVGTDTPGNVTLSFYHDVGGFTPDQLGHLSDIMQTEGAVTGSVWKPLRAKFMFKGTKLWYTNVGNGSLPTGSIEVHRDDEVHQALLLCGLTSTAAGTRGYGYFRVTGICDFYRDASIDVQNIAPSLELSKKLFQAAYLEYMHTKHRVHSLPSFTEWARKFGDAFKNMWLQQQRKALLTLESEEKKE